MKKWFSMLLAGAMVCTTLAGCGGAPKTGGNAGSGSAAGSAGQAQYQAMDQGDIKVGVLHLTDPAEGAGYTYTHEQGIQGLQKNIGLSDDQIIRKLNVDDQDATKINTAIEELLEEGCNIIFGTSWGYMDYMEDYAAQYPDVMFAHGSGYKSNGTNFINYFGKINQARYLSGIAAGMKTASGKIGYVAAQPVENGEVTSGVNAFAMGVQSVNPDAQVYVSVTGSWFNPEGEGQAAKALIDKGCDVITQHVDTANPATEAEKAGVFAVGYNSDMSKEAPKATLTSVMWDWSVFYTKAVQDMIDGTWTGENYFGDMKDGLVMLSDLSDLCAPGTAEAIQEVQDKILSGEWDVFDGKTEYKTKDGETKTLKAEDYGQCNWYYENVVVA